MKDKNIDRVKQLEERLERYLTFLKRFPEKARRWSDIILEDQREYRLRAGEYYKHSSEYRNV